MNIAKENPQIFFNARFDVGSYFNVLKKLGILGADIKLGCSKENGSWEVTYPIKMIVDDAPDQVVGKIEVRFSLCDSTKSGVYNDLIDCADDFLSVEINKNLAKYSKNVAHVFDESISFCDTQLYVRADITVDINA